MGNNGGSVGQVCDSMSCVLTARFRYQAVFKMAWQALGVVPERYEAVYYK